jgi:hypothetical protein
VPDASWCRTNGTAAAAAQARQQASSRRQIVVFGFWLSIIERLGALPAADP